MSLNAGSSFQCYLKFFLVIEFEAAIEVCISDTDGKQKTPEGFSVCSLQFIYFLIKDWTVIKDKGAGLDSVCGVLQ